MHFLKFDGLGWGVRLVSCDARRVCLPWARPSGRCHFPAGRRSSTPACQKVTGYAFSWPVDRKRWPDSLACKKPWCNASWFLFLGLCERPCFQTPVADIDDLTTRIREVIATVNVNMLANTWNKTQEKTGVSARQRGAHYEVYCKWMVIFALFLV